jgi:pimeloyl-ACP methyl ester carboxylesterase
MIIQTTSRPPEPSEPGRDAAGLLPPGAIPRAERYQTLGPLAVDLAIAAYWKPEPLRAALESAGATDVLTIRSGSQFALACRVGGRAWIAFRGSDDLDDWVANLSMYGSGQEVPWVAPDPALAGCHPGFGTAWDRLRYSLGDWLGQVEPEAVVLAGHSLGGALATLAAASLARSGRWVEATITIGAPRVGRPAFAAAYAAQTTGPDADPLGAITWRVVNKGDAVPAVPPTALGFQHVGEEVPFGSRGTRLGSQVPMPQTSPLGAFVQFVESVWVGTPVWALSVAGRWGARRKADHAKHLYGATFSHVDAPFGTLRVSQSVFDANTDAPTPPSPAARRLRLAVVAVLLVVVGGALWGTYLLAPKLMAVLVFGLVAFGFLEWIVRADAV